MNARIRTNAAYGLSLRSRILQSWGSDSSGVDHGFCIYVLPKSPNLQTVTKRGF